MCCHHQITGIPSATEVEELASGILQQNLQLVDHGPKCTVLTLLRILFFAAARLTSIFDACQRLRDAPTDQAVRTALVVQLPKQMPALERRLDRALQAKLPKGLFRKNRPMVVDLSDICYYGQPWKRKRELRRGKRKQGTSRFHGYATLYVVHRGERFTLAVTYVWKDDSNSEVLHRLLEQARAIGLRPRYLLLDRAFYSVAVVQYLKSIRCPFLMPVVHHGGRSRKARKPRSPLQSPRRFLAWKKSGWSTHLMTRRQQGHQQTSVKICVAVPQPNKKKGKKAKRRAKPLVFAFWGFRPASPAWVRSQYRRRYGIETSYRQMNQGRIRTCSRNPYLRLLLVGIALVLRNVWVWVHRMLIGRRRGRGLQLRLERLRLRTLLLMLQRCAEAVLGRTETAAYPSANEGLPAASGP